MGNHRWAKGYVNKWECTPTLTSLVRAIAPGQRCKLLRCPAPSLLSSTSTTTCSLDVTAQIEATEGAFTESNATQCWRTVRLDSGGRKPACNAAANISGSNAE